MCSKGLVSSSDYDLFFKIGCSVFQAGFKLNHVAEDDLELLILLLPPECWGYRCVSLSPAIRTYPSPGAFLYV